MVKARENRIPIMMSDDELTAIDDWRFANRVATRSDAVRRLCQIGLLTSQTIEEISGDAEAAVEDIFAKARAFTATAREADPPAFPVVKAASALLMSSLSEQGSIAERIAALAETAQNVSKIGNNKAMTTYVAAMRKHIETIDAMLKTGREEET